MTLARKSSVMRGQPRLQLVPDPQGTFLEGQATRVRRDGRVEVRVASRSPLFATLPQHVSVVWVRAALAIAPLHVAVVVFPSGTTVLWCVMPSAVHAHVVSTTTVAKGVFRVDAPEGVELRCGEASLTFEPDGKVQLRGKEILSRASGVHRIKGGAVRIN